MKAKRAALYLRVSTDGQTTENQRLALEAVAQHRGWQVAQVYEDAGISGAKGRDKRPAFDAMLKDAMGRRFDVLMFWSIDRMGRSTKAALDRFDGRLDRMDQRIHTLKRFQLDCPYPAFAR